MACLNIFNKFKCKLIFSLYLFSPLTILASEQNLNKELNHQTTKNIPITQIAESFSASNTISQHSSKARKVPLPGEEEEEEKESKSDSQLPTEITHSFTHMDISSDKTNPSIKAEILLEGRGLVDINGVNSNGWPEGYCFKKQSGRYSRIVLSDQYFSNYSTALLNTWNPREFTSLSGLAQGEKLNNFKLVVHGLELKHLDKNLEGMSFDDFIKQQLNPDVPLRNNFIPLYPYFFHKKTMISASVICEWLTATFGEAGFVLTVPPQNYLCGAKKDIHTPTDIDFYNFNKHKVEQWRRLLGAAGEVQRESVGEVRIKASVQLNPLPRLHLLLPSKDNSQDTKVDRLRKEMEDISSLMDAQSLLEDKDKLSFTNIVEDMIQYGLKKQQENKSKEGHSAASQQSGSPTVTYNEIAISPSIGNSNVLISGVFLRSSKEKLEVFLSQQHIQKLMDTARAFDLPVIIIYDGNKYDTSGAGGLQK
ncbi:hypothetical protein [Candidatus Paracaedibacter symbiosus]|uniref:hypothetical protein n=1 Tax=Candidatus Paracaedibacter symbiosus TaxID=244582 RepID=UPI000509EB79|nr:hypothetical protein [Candidatus Paracaedibacter symbiosus]